MISQAEIRKRALARWNSGAFLASLVTGSSLFPIIIRFRTPSGKELLNNYSEVRTWIETLRRNSREGQGKGYEILWKTARHRHLGDQQLPRRIQFTAPADWLSFIGKTRDHESFAGIVDQTRQTLPGILPYLAKKPLKALSHGTQWPQILTVCSWFEAHPFPDKYIRQLHISGVDTKFIETHKALLMDLLPLVVPPSGQDETVTGLSRHGFERRFGLRYDPPLVRFRLLDPDLSRDGFSDLTVPLAELKAHDPGVETVFITENKINGLSFPQRRRAMVIFGLGYGADMLAEIPWLSEKKIFYWGDIDTHGFSILSKLRSHWPHMRSILMDRETFEIHKELWGVEQQEKRFSGNLSHLSPAESALFNDLKRNHIGLHLRMEQERIRFSVIVQALNQLSE
jgi:hypothetical protein